jgi:hypothetical protein
VAATFSGVVGCRKSAILGVRAEGTWTSKKSVPTTVAGRTRVTANVGTGQFDAQHLGVRPDGCRCRGVGSRWSFDEEPPYGRVHHHDLPTAARPCQRQHCSDGADQDVDAAVLAKDLGDPVLQELG